MGNKKKSELGVQISLDTDDEWALATGKEVSLQNAAISNTEKMHRIYHTKKPLLSKKGMSALISIYICLL